ncbi:MAG TPA: DNA primase [Patescibacteria group bacterium]|nr:DNA primase [Patescibacteria group bacterium]
MRDQVQEIKDAIDIVQLIGERVQLTRAGKSFKGLCPFHSEKTPSFFVTPDIQRYKCFGCAKSGDVFTFLEEYDSVPFIDALQQLAKRAGITLEQKVFSKEDTHRQRLYEVLNLASEYYAYLLNEHAMGQPARDYIASRGITKETITTFKLGFALNSWDALQKYLVGRKKYTEKELLDAGLVIQGTSHKQPYDRFRGRLMFPLTDAQGRVVGFSGRVLDPKIKEAKYINSPETTLYHKSELLFGFSTVRPLIKKEDEVFIVEGELDALSSYQAGIKNIVAIKGSALTEQQVKLLSRTVKNITLALDADSAGIEATTRAIVVARPFDIRLRVLPLVGGKDPDDIAREHPKTWRDTTKHTQSVYEYLLDSAFVGQDISTGEGRRMVSQKAIPVLAAIENAVEQVFYIENLAKKLQIKQDVIESELRKCLKKQIFGKNVVYGSGQVHEKTSQAPKAPELGEVERQERYLVSLLLHADAATIPSMVASLDQQEMSDPLSRQVIKHLSTFLQKHIFDLQAFARSVPMELQQTLSDLYLEHEFSQDMEKPEVLAKEWPLALETYRLRRTKQLRNMIADSLSALQDISEKTLEQEKEYNELLQQLKDVHTAG